MQQNATGLVARVTQSLTMAGPLPSDPLPPAPSGQTGQARRARLALRIALVRLAPDTCPPRAPAPRRRGAEAQADPAPVIAPQSLPEVPPAALPDELPQPAPARPRKPARMSSVRLEDAALLLGHAFPGSEAEQLPAPPQAEDEGQGKDQGQCQAEGETP